MKIIQTLSLMALMAGVSTAAMALDAEDQKKVCDANATANVELVKQLNAATNEEDRKALLQTAVKRNPGNAVCLADLLKGSAFYDDAVEIMAAADDEVEPAGGPNQGGGNTPDDLGNPNNGGNPENPGQVSPNAPSAPPVS